MEFNEEIDDTEYLQEDFTTATDWEVFIARIEEIINQWRSDDCKGQSETCRSEKLAEPWNIRTESLTYIDFEFTFSYLKKRTEIKDDDSSDEDDTSDNQKRNVFDTSHDFELYDLNNDIEHSCLSRWYGINEYIVLSAAGNAGITTESKIKILLSSIYIASANTRCEIPLFVQIREKWQKLYLGVYECGDVRTNIEMVHLKHTLQQCKYLSGLLDMFKMKIVAPTMTKTIAVSLQSSYVLSDFGAFAWKQEYPSLDGDHFDASTLSRLPFGVTIDPIGTIVLKTCWSQLNHRMVKDCETYSDFNPMKAPKWTTLVTTTDQSVTLLGECLTEFLQLQKNSSTSYDILGDFAAAASPTILNPFDLLTEPKVPTISSMLTRAARNSLTRVRRGNNAPLLDDVLVPMLYFIFPDADNDEDAPHAYKDTAYDNLDSGDLKLEHECRGFKTCNPDSLVWRLAIVLSHALQSLGGIRAFAHLWYEFTQEMRYRWENSVSIPGHLHGYPDMRSCLLHQKLQMLNCCVDRKQARENSTSIKPAAAYESAEDSSSSSSTDDEFFDAADKPQEEQHQKKKKQYSLWNQPVGRLVKFNNFKLITTGDDLYIPVTQEPVPKTEDQLEEDTDILLQLGSDAQGSEMRAKMMSASLLSDMESFKAANPGSILEDFIRWYSPRDWIESEDEGDEDEWGQKRGKLSRRMQIEDNFWVQTWKSAKPVPANRQKRLFDDTREAEKVLHFLDSRTLGQVCELLMPVLCHAAIYRLVEECQQISVELPDWQERLRAMIKSTERMSREIRVQPRRFENFVQEVTALELRAAQVNSLMYKLNPAGAVDLNLSNLVANLVTGREVEIVDRAQSVCGSRIVSMFSDAYRVANMLLGSTGESSAVGEDNGNAGNNGGTIGYKGSSTAVFPQAHERDIVMRITVPRPAPYSAECVQFLRAVLSKNEFRLVGAFAEDIVYF